MPKAIATEIKNQDKIQAKAAVSNLNDLSIQKKAFVSLVATKVLSEYLKEQEIELVSENNYHSGLLLFKDFNIVHITAKNNVKIAIRTFVDSDCQHIFISRNHFYSENQADIYVAIGIGSEVNTAELAGFIEARHIDSKKGTNKHIAIDLNELKSIDELKQTIISSGKIKNTHSSLDQERTRELFFQYMENRISSSDKEFFSKHIAFCSECSKEFNNIVNLDNILKNNGSKFCEEEDYTLRLFANDPLLRAEEVEINAEDDYAKLDIFNNTENFDSLDSLENYQEYEDYEDYISVLDELESLKEIEEAEQITDDINFENNIEQEIFEFDNENSCLASDFFVNPEMTDMFSANNEDDPENFFEIDSTGIINEATAEIGDSIIDFDNISNDSILIEDFYDADASINDTFIENFSADNLSFEENILEEDSPAIEETPFSDESSVQDSFVEIETINTSKEDEMFAYLDDLEVVDYVDEMNFGDTNSETETEDEPEFNLVKAFNDNENNISEANEDILNDMYDDNKSVPEEYQGIELNTDENSIPTEFDTIEEEEEVSKKGKAGLELIKKLVPGIAVAGVIASIAIGLWIYNKPAPIPNLPVINNPNTMPPISNINKPSGNQAKPEKQTEPRPEELPPAPKEAESAIKPPSRKDLNAVLADAFTRRTYEVDIRNVSWEVSSDMAQNIIFRNYILVTGQALKSALSRSLASSAESAINNRLVLKTEMDLNGNLKETKVIETSGSDEIDKICLDTFKATLQFTHLPKIDVKKDKITAKLIITF